MKTDTIAKNVKVASVLNVMLNNYFITGENVSEVINTLHKVTQTIVDLENEKSFEKLFKQIPVRKQRDIKEITFTMKQRNDLFKKFK